MNVLMPSQHSATRSVVPAMRTSEQIQAEIRETLGFVPAFFTPAEQVPPVFEHLWQQTLSAYIHNPLPDRFKEKLSAYLSRFCKVPYCMICHSCSLEALGIQAQEIFQLLELPPPIQSDIDRDLQILAAHADELHPLSRLSASLETSLLNCAIFMALEPEQAEPCRSELRRWLGEVNYQFLVIFIAYVKTCHTWMEAHPDVSYHTDQRVQDHFDALIKGAPALTDFIEHYWERVQRDRQSWAAAQAALAERQRNATVLQQTAAKNRYLGQAIASASEGVLITDPNQPDNPIIYSNPAFSRITGYIPEEILGHNCRFLQGADTDLAVVAEIRQAIHEQREVKATLLNYRKDGQPFWNELKIAPVVSESGKLLYFVGIQTDVTDRKQAEEKIREQAALLNVATDAIFVQSLQHTVLFWNLGAERLYGWSTEEMMGENAMAHLHPDCEADIDAIVQTVLSVGHWQGELHQITKSGKRLIVSSRWTLVQDEKQRPKFILIVNTDITEKTQLEAQFLRTQRMESIGTLAGGIAHDLNNILTPILSSAQLLLMQTQPQAAQQRRLLETIQTSARRGAALLKQVLSFARGVEGQRTALQARHLIAEIRQIARETFPRSIEVQLDLANDLWLVSGDATQLHQVLMNLCLNARDAMPQGGTLSVSAANVWIDEHYARMNLDAQAGAYIQISVVDTGMGIAPEVLDRIFEPFFTTKELGNGTGLGLSTVLGIVKSHRGFVEVNSTLGKGTQFKVYLPAVKADEVPPIVEEDLQLGQGELILVVDDETAIREINQVSLEAYGYRVITAIDGIDAIALYAEHRHEISAVLIDLMMPSMDGITAIRTLRKINPAVKIIAVSGLVSSMQAAERPEIHAFLSKPYTAKELVRTIGAVLQPTVAT